MEVPANSAQSWIAAFTGAYDDAELDLLLSYIRRGSFVLDVGASLGFYAIPLAKAVKDLGGRLVAVEPVRGNCQVLRRNIALNGLGDVVSLLPVALGDKEERVLLHIETGGTGNATIVSGLNPSQVAHHDRQGGTGTAEHADVRRLDNVELPVDGPAQACSLLKMDVEGFEMEMLEGASQFIAAHRPVIFGEFHPVWFETRGIDPSEPQRWAETNRYDCMELVYARPHRFLDLEKITLRPLGRDGARSGTGLLLLPTAD